MYSKVNFILALSVFCGLSVFSVRAGEDVQKKLASEAGDFVKATIEQVMGLLKTEDMQTQAARDKVMAVINPVFDFNLMARLTLGRHWGRMKTEQRAEFVDIFVAELRDSYLDRSQEVSDSTMVFAEPEAIGGGRVQIAVLINPVNADRMKTLYKAYKAKGGAWRIYDVEVQDVSIVSSYRSQYQQFLDEKSVDELLKQMREKADKE